MSKIYFPPKIYKPLVPSPKRTHNPGHHDWRSEKEETTIKDNSIMLPALISLIMSVGWVVVHAIVQRGGK